MMRRFCLYFLSCAAGLLLAGCDGWGMGTGYSLQSDRTVQLAVTTRSGADRRRSSFFFSMRTPRCDALAPLHATVYPPKEVIVEMWVIAVCFWAFVAWLMWFLEGK